MCSEDIPLRKKLELVFSLNTVKISKEKEELIRESYQNYYKSSERLEKRKTKKLIRKSAISLFISIILLFSYGLLIDFDKSNIITRVLLESLLIGGWVFAWEAVHLLFIDIIEPFHRRREIERFLKAKLSFKYITHFLQYY